jgi:hypothetical protein
MSSEKEIVFDIKPVLGEINSIIHKEVEKILGKFIEKYNLYEETHNLVMNIPAVKKLMNAKEMYIASNGQRDDLSTTIQEFYRKIQGLTKENETLRQELNKYKSDEHISLKISETERYVEGVENDEKMYEKIMHLTDSSSKKSLLNNMFKVSSEEDDEKDDDEHDEEDDDNDDEEDDEEDDDDEEEVATQKVSLEPSPSDDDEENVETEEEVDTEDEEDVFEIEIDDTTYFTNDEENGSIYEIDENGDPGKKIGHLKDGEPFFY